MSSVILQIGQCGNQVGQQLCELLEEDADNHKGFVYCCHDGQFRSVIVDSEPKVARRLLARSKTSHTYRETNVITGSNGRGSNWAFGYHGNEAGEHSLLSKTMKVLRKEIERCPTYSGTICLHSLAGGTGSGLGSRIVEALRDEYPGNYILSCAVAPHSLGDNPLQYYNMVLSLAALQRCCDGVLLFDNDLILRQLEKPGRNQQSDDSSQSVKSVSMKQVNRHIASSIAGLVLPTDSLTGSSEVSIGMEPWELIRSLCPVPTVKFMKSNFISRSQLSWKDLSVSLLGSVSQSCYQGNTFSSLSNLLVARGEVYPSFPDVLKTMEQRLKTTLKTVEWNPFPLDCWTAKSNPFQPANSISLTIVSNSRCIVPLLEHTCLKARQKFDVGAYLHWYQRYNCHREDFEAAFGELEGVVKEYREAFR